ncbi:hypothetical protein GCM10023238_01150 [Streptomyces heliomycini]
MASLTAADTGGRTRPLTLPDGSAGWAPSSRIGGTASSSGAGSGPTRPRPAAGSPPTFVYGTGHVPRGGAWAIPPLTVRLQLSQPRTSEVAGVATDRYLASTGARTGQRVDVTVGGSTVPVRIVRSVRELPSASAGGTGDGGALLLDLRSVNRVLQARHGESVSPPSGGCGPLRAPRPGWPRRCATGPTSSRPRWWCGTRSPHGCATTRSARAPRRRSRRRPSPRRRWRRSGSR